YFSGKEEILELILDRSQAEAERAVDEAQQMVVEAAADSQPVALFVKVYRRYAESIDAIRRYTLLAYQEAKSLAPKSRTPLFERERRIAAVLKAAAEPGIRAGVFTRDALDLRIHSVIVLAHAWAFRHWAWTEYPTIQDYLADLEKIAVAILSNPRPSRR
ncbi:MAG: hypothetical protein ACREQ9_06460, partial [Candidatus Binatia bacterium]